MGIVRGKMKKRINLLDEIIKDQRLAVVFQPIISLKNGDILGYEALSRTPFEETFRNIEDLFSLAKKYDRLWELERLRQMKTLQSARSFLVPPFNKKLFMNVSPQVMKHEKFHTKMTEFFLSEFHISPRNIIFEVTEQSMIDDMQGFQSTLSQYKSDNFSLAIDDAGVEYAGLNAITDFNPNYIKIDMKLIRNIQDHSLQGAIVKGMVEFSKVSNVSLIAEGVETYEELETITRMGVQYAQGYYIQRPHHKIQPLEAKLIQDILDIRTIMMQEERNRVQIIPIEQLSLPTHTISSDTLTIDAYEIMNRDVDCYGLTILEDGKPIGILTKKSMALTLSGRYGFTLYQNKPISKIMDHEFLSVDYRMPISIVAELAMDRPQDKLYDFVVVTKDDQYHGSVTIKRMLQKVTELEVSSAKQQNPLTGLPGNIAIEHRLNNILKEGLDFSAVYLDIDNFKPYNDVYGFETGDLIIKLLAKLAEDFVPTDQFIGHIGGDDFIILFDYHIHPHKFNQLVEIFESEVLKFYIPEDRQKGYISAQTRNGEMEKFPLISVTAVTVDNSDYDYKTSRAISEDLATLKNIAKLEKLRII